MLYFNNASSRRPLHYHILNPIGAMQRKAIVCCMTLTQLHSEKEREAIQPNMWIHFTRTAGRRLLLQSQFHSRRMCIQNHIYHLFQSIDNVFQYLYFYQYLLEAFHSEPNSPNYKIFFHSELASGKCTTAIQFH